MIWGEWNFFFFGGGWKVSASFESTHIAHRRLHVGKLFLPEPHKTLGSVKGWFFILERTEALLFWFYLCFQERTKRLLTISTLKAGKVKVLEYLRKLGSGLKSFSSNLPRGCSYTLWDNEPMDDTNIKALESCEKNPFEIDANFWLWILQIVETAAKGRSKFLLIQDKIWALWNVTWFEAWMWILLETPPSYPAMMLQRASKAPEHSIRTNPTCAVNFFF